MKSDKKQLTISIGTTNQETREEIRKHIKILAAMTGKNQDEALLSALKIAIKQIQK